MAQFNKIDNQVLKAFNVFKETFLCKGKSIFDETVKISKDEISECKEKFENAKNGYNGKQKDETKYDAIKRKFLEEKEINDKHRHILAHAEWLWALPWDDVGKDATLKQIKKTLGLNTINKELNEIELFPQGIISGGQSKTSKIKQIILYLEFFLSVFQNDEKNESNLISFLPKPEKNKNTEVTFRNILLYLIEPTKYEPIASPEEIKNIIKAFEQEFDLSQGDHHELLREIRIKLSQLPNISPNFSFYDPPIRYIWKEGNIKLKDIAQEDLKNEIEEYRFIKKNKESSQDKENLKTRLKKSVEDYNSQTKKNNTPYVTRNNEAVAIIKILRDFKCQICGYTIEKESGGKYIEAAHIKSKSRGGEETPENIILLCPNHHKEFDFGKLKIDLIEKAKQFKIILPGKEEETIPLDGNMLHYQNFTSKIKNVN